jgi:hypothetical protein
VALFEVPFPDVGKVLTDVFPPLMLTYPMSPFVQQAGPLLIEQVSIVGAPIPLVGAPIPLALGLCRAGADCGRRQRGDGGCGPVRCALHMIAGVTGQLVTGEDAAEQ